LIPSSRCGDKSLWRKTGYSRLTGETIKALLDSAWRMCYMLKFLTRYDIVSRT
jgi:hypothetical protein